MILDDTCGGSKIPSFLLELLIPVFVEVQPFVVRGSMSTVQPRARFPNQFSNGTNPVKASTPCVVGLGPLTLHAVASKL